MDMDMVDMLGMMDMVDMVDMMDMVDVVVILLPGFAQDILVSLNWRELFLFEKSKTIWYHLFKDLHRIILKTVESLKKKHLE